MSNLTLEAFVNSIRNLYQSQSQTSINYVEIYNTINSNLDVFNDNTIGLIDNVLPVFTLPEFTLPNMAVLFAVVTKLQAFTASGHAAQNEQEAGNFQNSTGINLERLLNEIENCIQKADEKQVDVAIDIYSELCHYYTNKICQANTPKRGLGILRTAVNKLQFDTNSGSVKTNQLTTVHADLLQVSLASKNFSIALKLLKHEILDLKKTSTSNFDSKYLLSYFYYAGCIYASFKQFEISLFYLEQAITMPASVLSQIMIESYKKFILISLIYKGKLPMLPKYTSRIVINQIKPICSIYHELATAFINYEQEKLNSICQKYQDTFQQDKNYGLIKQLKHSFYKKNIQKLTRSFITLSLNDMAVKVKLATAKDAENLILNMIKDGEIFATINQKDGMVSFHDNPEKYDNPIIMENLTKQMFECIDMDSNIKKMDNEITTHPHYIQKCQNSAAVACDDSADHPLQSLNGAGSSMRQPI